ncbi:CcmD family protein [Sphingobacteriaceae bacterium]|nr:CcmD family protein [Sphingobacteriaceae bacterium]
MKKILGFVFVLLSFFSKAEGAVDSESPEMADAFRLDGKIYIVIAVIGIIFLSLVCLLVYIERKLKKIEAKVNEVKHDKL